MKNHNVFSAIEETIARMIFEADDPEEEYPLWDDAPTDERGRDRRIPYLKLAKRVIIAYEYEKGKPRIVNMIEGETVS